MSENLSNRKRIIWVQNCRTVTEFQKHEILLSSNFELPIGEGQITKWQLGLFPKSATYNSSYMTLYLLRDDKLKIQFTVNYSFYVNGKSGRHAETSFRKSSDVFEGGKVQGGKFISYAKFKESFDEMVVDGNFEIGCEISIETKDSKPSSSQGILKNIQRMYDDEFLKDFELRCSDRKTLKCHKNILATQSQVFRAMLTNDMKEANQGFVDVPDFDSRVMTEVLRFMYGFPAENLDNIAEELIFAAEKYDLDGLKQKCIGKIVGNLSKENVIQALLISDKVSGSEQLFEECIVVVAGYFSVISKKPAWAGLSNGLLTKIMRKMRMIPLVKTERINNLSLKKVS